METLTPYWQQITLTSGGTLKREIQPEAQALITRLENQQSGNQQPSARILQQFLMAIYHSDRTDQPIAETCLRNFITHSLYQRAAILASRFGKGQPPSSSSAPLNETFNAIELFCCVFESPLTTAPTYQNTQDFYDPLVTKILTTFNPEKGSLASWCTICFQGSRAVKRFLREHGVLMETNWQMLCRTGLGKLHRLLTAANCTPIEIEQGTQLLDAFHQVYRAELYEQRRTHPSRRPYPAPTDQQLSTIGHCLSPPVEIPSVGKRLSQLAEYVRQDRLRQNCCRGPSSQPVAALPTASSPEPSANDAIKPLLDSYCKPCLAQAVEHTITQRLTVLQQKRKGETKAQQFLQALNLFYCDSQPMNEIAAAIGLNDQSSISRLLQRNALQVDIRRQVLACLLQRVRSLVETTESTSRLQALDQQIANYLDPYVERIIAADQREGYTSKHRQMTSTYATHLCRCAIARRNPS